MSFIIHGIDMPKRKHDVLLVKIFPNGGLNWWNALGDSEIARTQTGRAEQLQPHGRLIDAETLLDNLMNEMRRKNYDEKRILILACVMDMINAAPTIIEAEGGNEENDKH